MAEMSLAEMVDTSEAARLLGVTRGYVNYLVLRGALPASRIGQHWFIRRDDLPLRPTVRARRLSPAFFSSLAWLAEHDGSTVRELADATGRPRRTALLHLQALEAEGLLRREATPTDTRAPHRIFVTAEGRTRLDAGPVARGATRTRGVSA